MIYDELEDIPENEDKQITPEVIKVLIKQLDSHLEDLKLLSMDVNQMKKEIESCKQFCMDYLDHVSKNQKSQKDQYEDFEEYARLKEYVDYVALAEKTLNSLTKITGLDARKALNNHLIEHVNSVVNARLLNYRD